MNRRARPGGRAPADDTGSPSDVAPDAMAVQAMLREIAALLERLLQTGEPGQIDLRSLPLSPAGRGLLRESLGSGEVSASIQALGESTVEESLYPGVWWITHRNLDGDVMAEAIEVAYVPEILSSDPQEASRGLQRLRERLATTRDEEP